MGYERSALLLVWPEDSELFGLEIRMRRLSVKQLLHIEKLSDLRKGGDTEQTDQAMTDLLDMIGKGLLGWNLEESGVPVPATRESLDDRDVDLVVALVSAWVRVATAVPLASPPSSPTGEPEPPDDDWASYLASNQEISPAPVS